MNDKEQAIQAYRKEIKKLSYKEKVCTLFDLYGKDGELTREEKEDIIYSTFSKEDKEDFKKNQYQSIKYTIISLWERFWLIRKSLDHFAETANGYIKIRDNSTLCLRWINSLIAKAREGASRETPEQANKFGSCTDILESLQKFGTTAFNSDTFVTLEPNGQIEVLEDMRDFPRFMEAIDLYTKNLKEAKGYYTALREFMELTNTIDFIPQSLLELEKKVAIPVGYMFRYNKAYINDILAKPEEERLEFEKELLDKYTNRFKTIEGEEGDHLLGIFPDYREINPLPSIIGENNIFTSVWKS